MAQDLEIIEPRAMLSLPSTLEWLTRSLGTLQWPGEPMRYTLMGGVTISPEERKDLKARLTEIERVLDPSHPDRATSWKARFLVLSKMLLAYSVGSGSEAAVQARTEAYQDAVGDMPAWTVSAAVHRWHRGECEGAGTNLNYAWAPPPAILRAICKQEIAAYEAMAAKIHRLLTAVPIDEAMSGERTGTRQDIGSIAAQVISSLKPKPDAGKQRKTTEHGARVKADLAARAAGRDTAA